MKSWLVHGIAIYWAQRWRVESLCLLGGEIRLLCHAPNNCNYIAKGMKSGDVLQVFHLQVYHASLNSYGPMRLTLTQYWHGDIKPFITGPCLKPIKPLRWFCSDAPAQCQCVFWLSVHEFTLDSSIVITKVPTTVSARLDTHAYYKNVD